MSSEDLRKQLAYVLIDEDELTEVPRFDTFLGLIALAVAVGGIMISALSALAQAHGLTEIGESRLLRIMFWLSMFMDVVLLIFVPYYSERLKALSRRRRAERRGSFEVADSILRAWFKMGLPPLLFWKRVRCLAMKNRIPLDKAKLRRIKNLLPTRPLQPRPSVGPGSM